MKPLGAKKTRTHVEGHQNCATCHPGPKGGRAFERRAALALASEHLDSVVTPAELRLDWLRCEDFDFDVYLTERGTAHAIDFTAEFCCS